MPSFLKPFLRVFIDAADNIRSNKETSFIAVLTIAVAISIVGIFLLIYFNLNNILLNWSEKLQLVVYLRNDIKESEFKNIEGRIRKEGRIWKWDYLSKEDALRIFKKRLKGKSGILQGLETNPLPASFNVYFKEDYRNYEEIKLLAQEFNSTPGVEDVDYGGEWIARFEAAVFFLKVFIVAVGGLLGIGLITIIYNTIRISVYSRSDEIEIKKLVGATKWFIQAPFLLEGIIQGIFGVFLALGLLSLFYGYFVIQLASSSPFLMGFKTVFIPDHVVIIMILLGGLVGGIGSFLSLGKLMRFDRSI